jgi:hypothetical protein
MKTKCRNCISEDLRILRAGIGAPFFLKRVFGIDVMSINEVLDINADHLTKQTLDAKILSFRSPVLFNTLVCNKCGFMGPEFDFTDKILSPLYENYRSKEYNDERCIYEPSYANIKDIVGKGLKEIENRLDFVSRILDQCLDYQLIHDVLDWGGAGGRFIPQALIDKNVYVLDPSDEILVNERFHKIKSSPTGKFFDYIQLCHILEHISSPYELMIEVRKTLRPGGYIYIEVPQDKDDADMEKYLTGARYQYHILHEHINLFTVQSVEALAARVGLQKMITRREVIDLGWTRMTIIGGLFRSS